MYYLYHIPGKKIGVTRDLNTRVTLIQGYSSSEYEVLDQSDDIDYISDKEIELQKSYGYKIDRKKYKNLFKKMKINVTEQTSTFAVPLNKLKGHLMDNLGMSWETSHGIFQLDMQTTQWIIDNAVTSMYNDNRCYVYNRAMVKFYMKHPEAMLENCSDPEDCCQDELSTFDLIRQWAEEKGIYDKGDPKTQYVKLMEEAGEVGRAVLKTDLPEIKDGIGDMVVVLTNLAELCGTTVEKCTERAYSEIVNRQGKMVNGTFVKNN